VGHLRFDWPVAFAALAILPIAAVAYLLVERRRARYAVRFTNLDVLAAVLPLGGTAQRRRFVPPALFALAIAVALVGVARPAVAHSVAREQATVIMVIDTSGSMVANDVEPTRLAAAQEAMDKFVKKLPGRFQVGLVTFSSQPRVAVPVTDDHDLIRQSIEHITPFGGTAIGDAIARAIDLLRQHPGASGLPLGPPRPGEKVPPSAIVLMSDGAQNRGRLQPLEAALRAKKLKIPVYTVALGTPGGTIKISDGAFSETISVPPDPRTMRQVALETGAQSYNAVNSDLLNAAWERLASRLASKREYHEATYMFLGGAALLLLGAGVASFFFSPRLP
jgi:Ca-activated chloride channel family protein